MTIFQAFQEFVVFRTKMDIWHTLRWSYNNLHNNCIIQICLWYVIWYFMQFSMPFSFCGILFQSCSFQFEKVRGWYNFCKAFFFSTCQHFYLQLGNWLKYNVIARCTKKNYLLFFVHKLLHSIFLGYVKLDRKKVLILHLKVRIDLFKDKYNFNTQ